MRTRTLEYGTFESAHVRHLALCAGSRRRSVRSLYAPAPAEMQGISPARGRKRAERTSMSLSNSRSNSYAMRHRHRRDGRVSIGAYATRTLRCTHTSVHVHACTAAYARNYTFVRSVCMRTHTSQRTPVPIRTPVLSRLSVCVPVRGPPGRALRGRKGASPGAYVAALVAVTGQGFREIFCRIGYASA